MVKSTNIFKMLIFIILMTCEMNEYFKKFNEDDFR
jgi:hypothetical protein